MDSLSWDRIDYASLNSRQKENYRYFQLAALLSDYGYVSMRLSDDWRGADFIAQHIDGTFIKVQLKSRLTFNIKYDDKELYIAFLAIDDGWYLYPHHDLLERVLTETTVSTTASWNDGHYSFPVLSKKMRKLLEPYKIPPITGPVRESNTNELASDISQLSNSLSQ
jgi:hypothetical protein